MYSFFLRAWIWGTLVLCLFLGVVHAHCWDGRVGVTIQSFVFLLVWNMQLHTILYNLVIRIGVPTSIILLISVSGRRHGSGAGKVMDCKMDKHNYSKHACISNTNFPFFSPSFGCFDLIKFGRISSNFQGCFGSRYVQGRKEGRREGRKQASMEVSRCGISHNFV